MTNKLGFDGYQETQEALIADGEFHAQVSALQCFLH